LRDKKFKISIIKKKDLDILKKSERGSPMKISIVGAGGSVGSSTAFYLATEKLADELVLIDNKKNLVQQHAMDMSTAVSTLGVKVRAGIYEDMEGSDIVINAAGAPQGVIKDRMEMLPSNIVIIKGIAENIKKYASNAIIITATNPADPMNYATYLAGGFDRRQVMGYTINDTFRFRQFLAKAFNAKASEVDGLVIGEHGSTQVLLFSTAKISGNPVDVSEDVKKDIYAEISLILKLFEDLRAGRTAGWTCAVGMATYVRAIIGDKKQLLPCSAVLNGEYGLNRISMSVPAVIGRKGIEEVRELGLADDERNRLKNTVDKLAPAMRRVEKLLVSFSNQ
jgi:malate dehydrogenase